MARNLLRHPDVWGDGSGNPMSRLPDAVDGVLSFNNYDTGNYYTIDPSAKLQPGDYVSGVVYAGEGYHGAIQFDSVNGIEGSFNDRKDFYFPVTDEFYLSIGGYLNVGDSTNYESLNTFMEIKDQKLCLCDDKNPSRTLAELRHELLMRLGYAAVASNPPAGMPVLLDSFLQGAQRYLYRAYPVLRTERFYTWEMAQGVRFYDLDGNADECPRKFDPHMVSWVGISDGDDQWRSLTCGIPPESYDRHDKQGVPYRYEIRQCIEVWPAPAESGRWRLRVKGDFGLEPFAADADRCTIDDEVVLLHALARAKAHYGQPDAANYERDALALVRNLTAGTHHTRRYVPGTRYAIPDGWPGFMREGA